VDTLPHEKLQERLLQLFKQNLRPLLPPTTKKRGKEEPDEMFHARQAHALLTLIKTGQTPACAEARTILGSFKNPDTQLSFVRDTLRQFHHQNNGKLKVAA